jgi:O-6-methylguanine DNA methyltransferase
MYIYQRLLPVFKGNVKEIGLAFQWKVYEALRAIPSGHTRTYEGVAKAIGQPRAVRAVARACAASPAAIVIPCHRVVRKDGGLGGYRWGTEIKQALLTKEKNGNL